MTPPTESPQQADEPIQVEALHRLRRLGQDNNDENILGLVIASFHHEAARWSDEIRAGLATSDLAVIQQIAHTLRGSASIFGAARLVEICGELESCADRGDIAGCELRLPLFDKALSEVLSALSRVEQEPPSTTPSR